MVEDINMELLGDAFSGFREASLKLANQYSMLERRIDELNAELAEKNKAMERTRRLAAMGEMAAKIAHEIRNPLGSISLFSSLLERDLSDEPEKKRLAERITGGVKTLDNLLSNMLLFAGAPEARVGAVDMEEVVGESLLLTRMNQRQGIEVETFFAGPSRITADRGMLQQLFMNLFLNAADAMEGGGTLTVETGMKGEDFELIVRDTGQGIPGEHVDRIFDPFFSTRDRGTGLGMAIVATVVDAHGGSIEVDSTEGKGTAFIIRLPLERRESVGPETPRC